MNDLEVDGFSWASLDFFFGLLYVLLLYTIACNRRVLPKNTRETLSTWLI